jgi:hypothetical protein
LFAAETAVPMVAHQIFTSGEFGMMFMQFLR